MRISIKFEFFVLVLIISQIYALRNGASAEIWILFILSSVISILELLIFWRSKGLAAGVRPFSRSGTGARG